MDYRSLTYLERREEPAEELYLLVLILRFAVPVLLVFLGTGAGCLFPFLTIHPIPAIPAAKMAAVATASMVPELNVEDDSSSSFREEFLCLLLSEPNLDDVCMMASIFRSTHEFGNQ